MNDPKQLKDMQLVNTHVASSSKSSSATRALSPASRALSPTTRASSYSKTGGLLKRRGKKLDNTKTRK